LLPVITPLPVSMQRRAIAESPRHDRSVVAPARPAPAKAVS
jgi:hypothetical protein